MSYHQYKAKQEEEEKLECLKNQYIREPRCANAKIVNFSYNRAGICFIVDGWLKASDVKDLVRYFETL